MPHNIICPLCENSDTNLLFTFSPKHLIDHLQIQDVETINQLISHTYNLWENHNASYYKCNICEFTFAHPFNAGDAQFYNLIYQKSTNYTEDKWEYTIAKEIIKKNKIFTLLELGAGNGNFIKKILPELIEKKNIYTTEFSEFGKKCINDYGIACVSETISYFHDKPKFDSFFTAVCFFQFLEHIDNINPFLQQLKKITTDDAIIIIAVPNDKRRIIFEKLNIIEDIPPVHISRWNKQSFNYWANKNNWQVKEHFYEPTNYKEIIYYYLNNKTKILKKIKNKIKILILAFLLLTYLRGVFKICKKEMGVSQLVVLKKIENIKTN